MLPTEIDNNMKNISKTTKTILFASLIAAMILPFSGMDFAEAQKVQTIEDDRMIGELQNIVSNVGKTIQIKTLDDGTVLKLVTVVKQISDNEYKVKAHTVTKTTDGEKVVSEKIKYGVTTDGDSFTTETSLQTIQFVPSSGISTRSITSGWSQSSATPSDTRYVGGAGQGTNFDDQDGHCADGKTYRVFGAVYGSGTSSLTWTVDGWLNAYCIVPQPLDNVTMNLNSLQINPATSTDGYWTPTHSYANEYVTLSGTFLYNW
jgi:hypothetical protein